MHETQDTEGTANAETISDYSPIQGPLQEELVSSPFWTWETGRQSALGESATPFAVVPRIESVPQDKLSARVSTEVVPKTRHQLWSWRMFILIAEIAMAAGLATYLFAPSIFFRPPAHSRVSSHTISPSRMQISTPSKIPSATVPSPIILAQDDFHRPNQQFWGTASDGSLWIGDANSSSFFSIQADAGQIEGGKGFLNALLGTQRTDEEIVVTAGVNQFDQTNINLGAVLRWSDPNDYYKAYVDGTNLILLKKVRGIITRLAALPFPLQRGASFTLRFRIIGSQIQVAAWRIGMPEPTHWQLAIFDHSLVSGFGGLRAFVEPGTQMRVFSFQELTV